LYDYTTIKAGTASRPWAAADGRSCLNSSQCLRRLAEGRELRLAAWPALVNDKLLRDAPADIRTEIVLDQGDRQVDAR